ncbi:MAG: ammonium transporter [Planctomycetaceae bacterium]|nr:ammonium transporter [Planctomycetaceae bacterium]
MFQRHWLLSAMLALVVFGTLPASAQETVDVTAAADVAADAGADGPQYYEKAEINYTINTLIMFICAVLVLFMQAGFAMVEVGFNASKNAVNILFKNLMDLSIGVMLFMLVGYGLMYPGDDAAGKWFVFGGIWGERDSTETVAGLGDYSAAADFLFQVAFAATAATIVSGAVAGRMKFIGYLAYSAIITAFVYPISGMWKWGGGALAEAGFADFAGSVVVHAVGGFAGLAGAIVLGPRIGRYTRDGKSVPMLGHNMPMAALGVFILWVGWYGFNPGSQLKYSGAANAELTTYIGVTTTLSAAVGCFTAMVLSWVSFKKPDLSMALNGALAGLVGITANCDQVSLMSAGTIGLVSGCLVFGGIILLDRLKIDDPVGAFPVHGICGAWGGIATGIFGTAIPEIAGESVGRIGYVLIQLKSTGIVCAWSFVTMFTLFQILKALDLLRVPAEEEIEGLDMVEHGMPAYPAGPTGGMGGPLPLPSGTIYANMGVSPVPAHKGV